MNAEQRWNHLIDEVYGNLAIERPDITRDFVAQQLQRREEIRAARQTPGDVTTPDEPGPSHPPSRGSSRAEPPRP